MHMGRCCHCGAVTGCRAIWTPDAADLFESVLNGWTGNISMDRSQFGNQLGNGVIAGDPWTVGAVSGQLAFTEDVEEEDAMVVGTAFDSFSVGAMPDMEWQFIDDPDNACGESVVTSMLPAVNSVTRANNTAVPADLDDDDLVALGVSDSYPPFGIAATTFGPVVSFNYLETFNASATFSFLNGRHTLSLSCVFEAGTRQNLKRVKAVTTGTKPNRTTTFSVTDAGFTTGSDDYQLNFNWLWESTTRAASFYNTVTSQTETMTENTAVANHGWVPAGGRYNHGSAGTEVPTDPPDSLVTLPTFTNISWGQA